MGQAAAEVCALQDEELLVFRELIAAYVLADPEQPWAILFPTANPQRSLCQEEGAVLQEAAAS